MKKHEFRQETEAVRGGTSLAKKNGPLTTPIYQTSTFEVTDMQEQVRATPTDSFYTRYGNPTHTVAENAIAELEGTDAALLFSSGMAAITTSILSLVKAGDHIVAQRDIYGGVIKFLSQWLPKLGIETTFVDTNDIEQHERAIRPNTKILHIESPTNPTVRVVDLEKIAALARKRGLITTIDSTFATPINCRPAEWGIDLVLHSGTKYFGGHSDIICGIADRTTRFDRANPSHAHHARRLHGSARGVSAVARDQDAGRPGRTPERKRAADCRVPEPASQGDAGALSAAQGASGLRDREEANGGRGRRAELRGGRQRRRRLPRGRGAESIYPGAQPRRSGFAGDHPGADFALP